jgi:7-cyano-7-deazaguanine synthase in queuosine biosynthesis
MHACYRARKLGEPRVDWVYPVYECTKAEIAALLPAELARLTWSCRRPVARAGGWTPCGTCKACLAREGVSPQNSPP